MTEGASNLKGLFQERGVVSDQAAGDKLWKWVSFAGLLHAMLLLTLFIIPYGLSNRKISDPVYTVDLVGGEKLGGGGVSSLGPSPLPPAKPKEETKKAKVEQPAKSQSVKAQPVKKEKSRVVEKPVQTPQKMAMNELKAKEPKQKEAKESTEKEAKQKEAKNEAQPERGVTGQVREKLIESALDRIKERAQAEQTTKRAGGIASGTGTGEGPGAVAPGAGGQGGGIVKGFDFVVYYNRMKNLIKERWVWVGKRNDLEVTVHFGIGENGEIAGVKVVRASGDQSFDNSVLRAVRNASPLPPPPESYRKDFTNVELTFRPKDLSGGEG